MPKRQIRMHRRMTKQARALQPVVAAIETNPIEVLVTESGVLCASAGGYGVWEFSGTAV